MKLKVDKDYDNLKHQVEGLAHDHFNRYMESKGPAPDGYEAKKRKDEPETSEEIEDKLMAVISINLEIVKILNKNDETFNAEIEKY